MSEWEWFEGKQYLYITGVGYLSLLGTVAIHKEQILFDLPITFVIGNMAGINNNNYEATLKCEMRTVREHFPAIAAMTCMPTWDNVVETVTE